MSKLKSDYNWRNVLVSSPEDIKWTVLAGLTLAGAIAGLSPDLWETLGMGVFIERLLNLFYVKPVRKALSEADQIRGIALGQAIAKPARSR